MSYPFIAEYWHEYPITLMCCVREVSVSGYYAWCKRSPSEHSREDAHLAEQVKSAFQAKRGVYGSSRVHAQLQAQGITCGRKRVARLMRQQGLAARKARHRTITTYSDPEAVLWGQYTISMQYLNRQI
jgi:putative transposase